MSRVGDHIPCYQVQLETGEWVLIPGCIGAITHPDHCTCYDRGSENDQLRKQLDGANDYIRHLLAKATGREEHKKRLAYGNQHLREALTKAHATIKELSKND